jgi:hypothetical protein
MAIPPAQLMQAKLQGIKTALERAPASEKNHSASVALAGEFNRVIEQAAAEYEDIADALPKPVTWSGMTARAGRSDVSFMDLEALTEQVLNLLRLVDK